MRNAAGISPGKYGNQSNPATLNGQARETEMPVAHASTPPVTASPASHQTDGKAAIRPMVAVLVTAMVPRETHTDAPARTANATAANRATGPAACPFCDRDVILAGHILAHLAQCP